MRVLTKTQFWQAMCDFRFVRTGTHQGVIGDKLLVTFDPPAQGDFETSFHDVHRLLKIEPLRERG